MSGHVLAWIATAVHVSLRTGYLLGIGFNLRREAARDPKPDDYRHRWRRFRRRAAIVLDTDAVSFIALCALTYDTLGWDNSRGALVPVALLLGAVGIGAKLAARRVVGVEGYYWYDFFCPVGEIHHSRKGIYRYLRNPMYGPGYLHAVALALVTRSEWGLAAAFFDWIVIWIFNLAFERPHTRRMVLDAPRGQVREGFSRG